MLPVITANTREDFDLIGLFALRGERNMRDAANRGSADVGRFERDQRRTAIDDAADRPGRDGGRYYGTWAVASYNPRRTGAIEAGPGKCEDRQSNHDSRYFGREPDTFAATAAAIFFGKASIMAFSVIDASSKIRSQRL